MQPHYFEDLKVGMEFRSKMSEPFTEEMIMEFARLTGDRAHPPSVQGNFTVARSGGLLFESPGHFNETLRYQAAKDTIFKRPLRLGERIYVVEKIIELDERKGFPYGKVVLDRKTFNEKDELIVHTTHQDYRIVKRNQNICGAKRTS